MTIINMNSESFTKNIHAIHDILTFNNNNFNNNSESACFSIESGKEKYKFIGELLVKIKYRTLSKDHKREVKKFIECITHYKPRHIKTLISKWIKNGLVKKDYQAGGRRNVKYTHDDIVLLSKTDNLHEMRNGHAVKETLIREFRSGKEEYVNIMNISVSHIYNVRKENVIYRASSNLFYTKTKSPKGVNIGKRKKPHP